MLTYSQLTDEDIGHRVRVVERRESAAARSPATRSVVYRADFEPRPVLGGAAVIGTALAAFVIAAPAAHRIVTRLRGQGRSSTRDTASDG